LWPMCALRLPAQAERIAGAVLLVASGDIGMVAERHPGGWADGPDAKRVGGQRRDALAPRRRPPSRSAHDALRNLERFTDGSTPRPEGRQGAARGAKRLG